MMRVGAKIKEYDMKHFRELVPLRPPKSWGDSSLKSKMNDNLVGCAARASREIVVLF